MVQKTQIFSYPKTYNEPVGDGSKGLFSIVENNSEGLSATTLRSNDRRGVVRVSKLA
jgi:hypothetical protein